MKKLSRFFLTLGGFILLGCSHGGVVQKQNEREIAQFYGKADRAIASSTADDAAPMMYCIKSYLSPEGIAQFEKETMDVALATFNFLPSNQVKAVISSYECDGGGFVHRLSCRDRSNSDYKDCTAKCLPFSAVNGILHNPRMLKNNVTRDEVIKSCIKE